MDKGDLKSVFDAKVGEESNSIFAEIDKLTPDMRADYDSMIDRQQARGEDYIRQLDVGRDGQVGLKKNEILGGSAIKAYPEDQQDRVAQLQAEQAVDSEIGTKVAAAADQYRQERVTFLEDARMQRTQNLKSEFNHEAEHDLGE